MPDYFVHFPHQTKKTHAMKKLYLLVIVMVLFVSARSQQKPAEPVKAGDRFFFGLTYSYLNADMKLLSLTKHSVWDNEDLGTKDLSQDGIDTINSYMDYTEKVNDLSLSAGMVFLNKPGSHWYIDGKITVGFAIRNNIILNTDNDSADSEINSEHYSPSFGLGFNFKYLFNDKWALNLGMSSLYASGSGNKIDQDIFPDVSFMGQEKENKFRMSYTTASLLASYTVKKFSIAAGPGFYILYNHNEYHIIRTSSEDGTTYEDSIETRLRSDMFVNGSLQLGWRISGHFLISAGTGIGKDISANAGLIYFL